MDRKPITLINNANDLESQFFLICSNDIKVTRTDKRSNVSINREPFLMMRPDTRSLITLDKPLKEAAPHIGYK